MGWSEEDFFPAFASCGMLVDALYYPPMGEPVPLGVGFADPDNLLVDEHVQTTQIEIEFETAMAPVMANGERVVVGGIEYRVRGKPAKKADGFFSTVSLGKA